MIRSTVSSLRSEHHMYYSGFDIYWEQWAAFICKKADDEQLPIEDLISLPPPPELIRFIKRAPTPTDVIVQQVNQASHMCTVMYQKQP